MRSGTVTVNMNSGVSVCPSSMVTSAFACCCIGQIEAQFSARRMRVNTSQRTLLLLDDDLVRGVICDDGFGS